ncbi:hypothetical protein [Xanthomonas hortorum]|uniref:hypothetical protein n=1 Tax=Xanthomonas hortorum TaxID=56454 RepID=UPI001F1FFFD2|nr:hypothetical protein [Xanthomonas hortorum]MCE4517772.1 hypothetical protein [Xanthomonas hortorum pv. vitians]
MSDSPSVEWCISPAPVHGGRRIYVLTIFVNGKLIEQSYFSSRIDAAQARDSAMQVYRG